MDMSFMAKFAVQGRDAGRELEWLSANQVSAEPGMITYTQWLNEDGKLEADLTVTKLGEDDYYVVASDTAHRHALTWMRRHFAARDARARGIRRHLGLRPAQRPGTAIARRCWPR